MEEPSEAISAADVALINEAIKLLVEEKDLIPDWEFATLVGYDRAEFLERSLSSLPISWDDADTAIGALGNLLGYPHGRAELVAERLGDPKNLEELCDRLVAVRSHFVRQARGD